MLVLTRRSRASDPRDKVFGMLGLTAYYPDGEASTFMEPDHALSTDEVHTCVARRILVEDKDADLLASHLRITFTPIADPQCFAVNFL